MAGIDINRTTSGVVLPTAVSGEIWQGTQEQSAVMQLTPRVDLPGGGTDIQVITGDPEAEWVTETDEKPVSRGTLDRKTMRGYTLAVIEPFSNQFRRDLPTLYAELQRRLPLALGKKFDETVFGVGAAPGSNFDQLSGSPTATVDATGTFNDLAGVVNTLAAAGADLSAWVAQPAFYGLLLTATDGLGRQFFVTDPSAGATVGSVFGAPVYRTRATMPSGAGATADKTGFAGDWANSAVWGSVEGVQVAISDQATLNDGGTSINLWQRNMFALRAEIEIGFRVRDVNHFVSINTGVATP